MDIFVTVVHPNAPSQMHAGKYYAQVDVIRV
eukprot:SAG25_NODE_13140_length_271_cov_0.563953_1_plen_30_part_01